MIARAVTAAFAAVAVAGAGGLVAAGRAHGVAPAGSGAPIALADHPAIGTAVLPDGDVSGGGHGKPVGGIRCDPMEGSQYHVHAHLSVFVGGRQIAVPRNIGIVPLSDDVDPDQCYYWVHTHDATGIIHVESPSRIAVTLADFFRIWGRPLGPDRIADFRGPVRSFVDGRPYRGDPARIPIVAHAQITLEIGAAVTPPTYAFPSRN